MSATAAPPVPARGEVVFGEDESDDDVPTFHATTEVFEQPQNAARTDDAAAEAKVPGEDWVAVNTSATQEAPTTVEMDAPKKKKRVVTLPAVTAGGQQSATGAAPKRPMRRPLGKKPRANAPLEAEDEFGDTIPAPAPPELDSQPSFREASAPDLVKEEEELQARIAAAATGHADPNSKSSELGARAIAAKEKVIKVSSTWFGEISKRFVLTPQPSSSSTSPPKEGSKDATVAAAEVPPSLDRSSEGSTAKTPQEALTASVKRLSKVADKRLQDVVGQYTPSKYPLRCDQLRVPISVKLHHELIPPPVLAPIEDPPPVKASGAAPPQYIQPQTVQHPAVLAVAAYDLKRDWTHSVMQAAETAVHRELVVTERVGYQVMQTRANLAAFNEVMNALRDTVVAIDSACQPFFAPSSKLVVP